MIADSGRAMRGRLRAVFTLRNSWPYGTLTVQNDGNDEQRPRRNRKRAEVSRAGNLSRGRARRRSAKGSRLPSKDSVVESGMATRESTFRAMG